VANCIDLISSGATLYGGEPMSSPIQWLTKAFDPEGRVNWDRSDCEAFFNHEQKFVPLVERFDEEECEWREL